MTKHKRVIPARKRGNRSRDDESLLIRSAESLGRAIGSLQRQLDVASRRRSTANYVPAKPSSREGVKPVRRVTKKKRRATATRATARSSSGAGKKTAKTAAPGKTRQR